MPKSKKIEIRYTDVGGFFCQMKSFSAEINVYDVSPGSAEAKKIEKAIKDGLRKAGYEVVDIPAV